MSTGPKAPMIEVNKLPVEQAVAKLLAYSIMLPASDIFFAADQSNVVVSVRHLGIVQPIATVPLENGRRFASHVKALAGMDVAEKRMPQDGRWLYRDEAGNVVDLRVNMVPTLYGEDLALRILSRNTRLYKIEELGLGKSQFDELVNMLGTPGGLILFTGPTGSGKTATLYSALMRLNDGRRKINAIEDPIEHAIPGIRQSQVNPQINLGFSTLLRNILRQSPDVIMVGEIRDSETAETAVRAANSGHLVLATIHSPIAAGAVQSMRSLGVHPHFLATSLLGIISQRLVRTLCPQCKQSFDLSMAPHTFDDVRPWLTGEEGSKLFAPKGCSACQNLGYAGRTGVFEILRINRKLRDLISDARPTREIRAAAAADKMLEFRQSAMLKVAQGLTSTEEVVRVIPSEHLLEETLV
jgi:type II secretory ATPase GspE/PulE/Tfp pilus assembly ATPase PilB-like protein